MIDNEWMEFAKQDYLAVKRLQDDEYLTNIVLFHCQQCIEKLLKGILEANNIDIPRIHSTKKLYTLAVNYIDGEILLEDLEFIDSVYIESRYPASVGLLPNGQPTKKESKKAMAIVGRILEALTLNFDGETQGGAR